MQYTVNRGEKGNIEVKVDVGKVAFDEAYGKILLQLAAGASIAGFRKGKVPADVVEGQVGYNKILNETASSLIAKNLTEIFKKEELIPLDSPKTAIHTLAKGSPFSFTVSFTQKPQVKVGDWQKIKVGKVAAKEVTDSEVNESIKNIFEAWVKNSKVGQENQNREGGGKFIYDAQGNKVFFDKKTLRSSSSQDSTAGLKIPVKDEPAGSTQGVDQTSVQHTPGLSLVPDDEFAKTIGARDLVHLKELVKKDLETIVADQVEMKLEQDLFEEILKISDVEVPDILIEDELNRLLVRLSKELEKQGSDLDKYFAQQKTTIDELKTKWRPQAEKNVKITLIMDEIGRGEKVQVAKEEIEQALKGVSETNLSQDQKADLERYIALSIFQAKTLNLVKKTVTG